MDEQIACRRIITGILIARLHLSLDEIYSESRIRQHTEPISLAAIS